MGWEVGYGRGMNQRARRMWSRVGLRGDLRRVDLESRGSIVGRERSCRASRKESAKGGQVVFMRAASSKRRLKQASRASETIKSLRSIGHT